MFSENKKTIISGVMGAVIVGVIFGIGNFMQPATAGIGGPPCGDGTGEIILFNKILFTSTKTYVADGPTVAAGKPYEVIVPVPAGFILDPRADVVSELIFNGYQRPNENPPAIWAINILDVELAAECISFGNGPA